MNLVVIPFHDIKKSQKQGFRNRDGHFMQHFQKNEQVEKLLIINRPMSVAEMLWSRSSWKTKAKVILKTKNAQLSTLDDKTFVIDFLSYDVLKVLKQKKKWFWEGYQKDSLVDFINKSLHFLEISDYNILTNHVWGAYLISKLNPKVIGLDAFDNWLRFPFYAYMREEIKDSYQHLANIAHFWTSNSEENKAFFTQNFGVKNCTVIKNGVDVEKFRKDYEIPEDMQHIPRPILGFGGMITHLVDIDLYEYIAKKHNDKSFVIVGGFLEKEIFKRLKNIPNLHYLGNKHYTKYPAYVNAFDICLIPYHVKDKAHGGDSIKFYEYLAANKNVVSTDGNGVYEIGNRVWLAQNKEEFAKGIREALTQENKEVLEVPQELTWKYKTQEILDLFRNYN